MMKYPHSIFKSEVVENAVSWIIVFAMFVYGGAKLIQFEGAVSINKTVSEMTGMQLMWAFYGYSKSFAIILGILEITGGILILFPRTRLIGCLFTTTLLVNIIIQDIVFEVNTGALKAAIFYQFLILILFWRNRKQLFLSIKMLLIKRKLNQSPQTGVIPKFLITVVLFMALRVLEYYITIFH